MTQIIFGVAGGLAIFLYGMTLCSEGLQKASGSALKGIIQKLTSHPLMGVLVGTVVTVLIQSSSATTVILVGLVGASLMTLKQSIGVILGADVGTTLTVQLIAFNVTAYALIMIAVGFGIKFLAKTNKRRYLGQVILGFGFIFYGMRIMSMTMEPLRNYPGAEELFISFGTNPLLGLLVATLFTALVQGSAATIGIVLSLSIQGLIPLESAIPLILGANIGTCVTALLATIGAPVEAKRVGVAHVLFKVLGVILIFPFIGPFTSLVGMTATSVTRQIANAHSLFNIGITVVFLPLAAHFANFIQWLIPEGKQPVALTQPMYIEKRSLQTPMVALQQARAEVIRVAKMVQEMVNNVGILLIKPDEQLMEPTIKLEAGVDKLYKEITGFLADVSQNNLSEEESADNLTWIQAINDLEHIGDVVMRMMEIIAKLGNTMKFSEQGLKELQQFHYRISQLVAKMVTVLETRDENQISELLEEAKSIIAWENQLRVSHIRRLQARIAVSRDTSSIHLDLINGMRRIAEHVSLVARNVSKLNDQTVDNGFEYAGGGLEITYPQAQT